MEFEEVKYGMLMMVLCDREGRVYDVWITFGSVHEVRAFRERKKRSLWFRVLVYVYAYAIGYSYYRRGELEV